MTKTDSAQKAIARAEGIRVADAFTAADGSRKKAFVAFVTVGDPTLDVTERLVIAMAKAGVDLIELGIPFSDPTAEGPVIQEANLRALEKGVTTDDVFDMVERVRAAGITIPLVFMTYANVVYGYGIDRFAAREREVGMQGIILPDVPFEEKAEFAVPFSEQGLEVISLIAPTSHERIRAIAREAQGFVYVVSSLGVTGVRKEITTDVGAMVRLIREANPQVPAAVGFGISTPDQAARMAGVSDGAIVGSAIIKLLAQYGEGAVPHVEEYVRQMAAATHGA